VACGQETLTGAKFFGNLVLGPPQKRILGPRKQSRARCPSGEVHLAAVVGWGDQLSKLFGYRSARNSALDHFAHFPGSPDRLILSYHLVRDMPRLHKMNAILASELVETLRVADNCLPLNVDGLHLEQMCRVLENRLVEFYKLGRTQEQLAQRLKREAARLQQLKTVGSPTTLSYRLDNLASRQATRDEKTVAHEKSIAIATENVKQMTGDLLRVCCSPHRPKTAAVAVPYKGFKQDSLVRRQFIAAMVFLATLCASSSVGGQTINLVENGNFEQRDLTLGNKDEPGVWLLRNHGAGQASVEFVMTPDGIGGRCLRYRNTAEGSHNIHVDQLVRVSPNTVYEVQARVRGDGSLEPVIAVETKAWGTLATTSCGKSSDWSEVRLLFHSFGNDVVRFEWFPGAQGRLYTGVAGPVGSTTSAFGRLQIPRRFC
jgi:hypothetical protein